MVTSAVIREYMSANQQSLCTLFAEVAGSANLIDRLGKAEAMHAIERCLNRMRRAIAVHHGRVVAGPNDRLLAVFDSADQAVQAACQMQQRVVQLPPVSGLTLGVRVGMQLVERTHRSGGDVPIDAVMMAERLAHLAAGGQIVTTGTTIGALSPVLREAAREIELQRAGDNTDGVRAFEVVWQLASELSVRSSAKSHQLSGARLVLRHGLAEFAYDASLVGVTLGRDVTCDIVISDRRASRQHAKIERRRGEFVLVDQSTNGTFVTFDDEPEFALKHTGIVLRGRGRISFGQAYSDGIRESVAFEVTG